MFFDINFEHTGFFCIEKGNEAGSGLPFICSWTKDNVHSNYGNCDFESEDPFILCADIFMEEEYGMKRNGIISGNGDI